jgi:SpoVK/Ycf46/Vps4 family AAA+-type ATPase
MSLHLVFTGNPGTGKTTVARLLGEIYHEIGILSKGHLTETDRSGLVAGYLGQTAIKVSEVVQKASGGILFIDEAYSLAQEAQRDQFGREAIDTLIKRMEDHRDDLIVIVAGYTEPMTAFLESNPGLHSRFNKFLHFDDYSPQELFQIFTKYCADDGYAFERACGGRIMALINLTHKRRAANFGNARTIRNLFEQTISNHANRVASITNPSRSDLTTLSPQDVPTVAATR